ncbi:hypothetical protein DFH27DRAFT_71108 [Peziza echinospora]|nr:hypothetical protein DFH27DRAFT_71108 [Peziza echinospora]
MTSPSQKRQRGSRKAIVNPKFMWPADTGHEEHPSDAHALPPKPTLKDSVEQLNEKKALLTQWYLTRNASGKLLPKLVETISAVAYVFRCTAGNHATDMGTEDTDADDEQYHIPGDDRCLDPSITRSSKHIFLYHSTPIPNTILQIPIIDLYGPTHPISQSHGQQLVTFDLADLAEAITDETRRVEVKRAWKRTELVFKNLLLEEIGLQKQQLETMRRLEDAVAEEESDGGRRSRSKRRKRGALSEDIEKVEMGMGWVDVKKHKKAMADADTETKAAEDDRR